MPTYQHGAACFPTAKAANSAAAAEQAGSIISTTNGPAVIDLLEVTDNSITYALRYLMPPRDKTITTTTVNPPLCQLLDINDGMSMGWQIAAVWVAAFALKFLSKYIWSEVVNSDNSSYGNS